jgi:hypothetical protein
VTPNDVVREQAQALEDRVAGKKVTDVVDGLRTTGAELREEDVEVVRDGDKLVAELSPVGEERIGNIASRQTDEQAERAVEEKLNQSFTNADVSVDNSGNVGVSEDVQNEATEQAIAESNPGVSEDDITFQNGEPVVQQSEQENSTNPAQQVEEQTGLDQGEDFTLARDDGNVSVNVTERGAQELRGRREQQEGDALTGIVTDIEGVTGVDLPGNRSVAGEARQKRANTESGELLGDADFSLGLGGPEDEVEQFADSLPGRAEGAVRPASEGLFANTESLAPLIASTGREELAEQYDRSLTTFGEELAPQAAAGLASLPGAVIEGGEAAVAAGERPRETAERVPGAAAIAANGIARAAGNNPEKTAAGLVGGTAAATGLLKAGRAVGGTRGARAAGLAVQPGEEIAVSALRSSRAARGASLPDVNTPTPSVEADVGPNAASGRLEVNVNADIRRSLDDMVGNTRSRGQDVFEGAENALNTARNLPDRARTAVRNGNFNADAAVSAGRARAGDAADATRARVGEAVETAAEAPSAAKDRVAQTTQNAAVSAEANAFAASERVGNLVQRAELGVRRARRDRGRPSVPRGFVTDADSSLLPGITDRVESATQQARLEARRARRDFEFPSIPRGYVTDSESGSLTDTVSSAFRQGRMEARRARRDAEFPSFPRGYVTDSESGGINTPDFDINNPLSGLTDTSVRIDIGRPRSRSVDADRLEFEGQAGVEFRGELDEGSSGGNGGSGFESGEQPELFEVDADDAGNGQLQLRRTDTESRPDATARAESETTRRPDQEQPGTFLDRVRRAEAAFDDVGEAGAGGVTAEQQTQQSGVGVGERAEFEPGISSVDVGFEGVGVGTGIGAGVGLGQESGTETRQEPGTEVGQEPGTETRIEARQEARAETRQEVTAEAGFDLRREVKIPGEDDGEQQNQQPGISRIGVGAESSPADGAATGYIAETLTDFAEGGLNVDAARAASDRDSGFLATEAQASGSGGFEEVQEFFGIQEDDGSNDSDGGLLDF